MSPPLPRKTDDDDDDLDEMIARNPCAKEYIKLEDCLAATDRNFARCQKQIRALQACNNSSNTATKENKEE